MRLIPEDDPDLGLHVTLIEAAVQRRRPIPQAVGGPFPILVANKIGHFAQGFSPIRAALGAAGLVGEFVRAGAFAIAGESVSGTTMAPVGCTGTVVTAAGAPLASSLSRRSSIIEIAFSLTSLLAVRRLSWASIESSRARKSVIGVSAGVPICG